MQLSNKVTLITGASRGIGQALAVGFAAQGATVVAASRTQHPVQDGPEGSLEETARRITRTGGRVLSVPCDVSDEGQVKALVERVLARLGAIDVLINNAGILLEGPIAQFDTADWDQVMAVNIRGPFLMCKYVLPVMMERRRGSVINLTSRGAVWDMPDSPAHGPSKAALERFTLNLALDMKSYNIAVNALGPDRISSSLVPPEKDDPSAGGRLPPEEVVPAAAWLAQQDASTFTGRIVYRTDFGGTWP